MSELKKIIQDHKLPADMAERIEKEFATLFEDIANASDQAATLVVVTGDEPDAKIAEEARKAVAKMRISVEKVRKELKEPFLRGGQAVDAVAKALSSRIEPLETTLKELAGTKARLAEEAKRLMVERRRMELAAIGYNGPEIQGFADLPEETWKMVLTGHAAAIQKAKDDAAAAEALRLEEEERQRKEQEERDRLAKLGQSRREQLLLVGENKTSEELAPMSEDTFAEVLRIATITKENKEKAAALLNDRISELVALGAVKDVPALSDPGYRYRLGGASVHIADLEQSAFDFAPVLANFQAERNRLDEEKRNRERAREIAVQRQAQLAAIGIVQSVDQLVLLDEAEAVYLKRYNAAKAAYDAKQEAKAQAEILRKQRASELRPFGIKFDSDIHAILGHTNTPSDLSTITDDAFQDLLSKVRAHHQASMGESYTMAAIASKIEALIAEIDPASFPVNAKKVNAAMGFLRNAADSLKA